MNSIDIKNSTPNRLSIIDALRGFALFGLFSVHMQEHYNLFEFPVATQPWLVALDKAVPVVVYFLFAGKSYAIFAFFFGLSFFIQMDRQNQKGVDFSAIYSWRLLILFLIGFLHGLIYSGDILSFFAVTGFCLIGLYRCSSKLLLILALICLLELPILVELGQMAYDPLYRPSYLLNHMFDLYNGSTPISKNGSFTDVLSYNWYKGKKASWLYMFLYGRLYQTLGLFIIGILVGRSRIFENLQTYSINIRNTAIVSFIIFMPLYMIQLYATENITEPFVKERVIAVLASYANLAFGIFLCTTFISLYQFPKFRNLLDKLSPVGRMSLTNYVLQSLIMVPLLYGFGLGLYNHLGYTVSFLVGLIAFSFQIATSSWWMHHHHYGPLEWLWRTATFLSTGIPLRKKQLIKGADFETQ